IYISIKTNAVTELNKEFTEAGEPITDDCTSLHKFSYKLEYLLQFDQKGKSTLLGNRKDYWDYFCDCLAKVKGANDGIRFVKSITELRTSLGKGRAFLRYSLVHQRLADTLQQCFMNTKVTSDWYYARSPFLSPKMSSDIVGHLYELTEVQFDLASRGYDLDSAWPTFARRTLSSLGSSAYLWKPPSRTSSMSSLVSSYLQTQEPPSSPSENNFLNAEPLEGLDELHAALDQAELQQKELKVRIHHLEKENQDLQATIEFEKQQVQAERDKSSSFSKENTRLMEMLGELEKQREISHCTQDAVQELQKCLQALELNAAEKQKEYSAKLEELESRKKNSDSKLHVLNEELEASRTSLAMKDNCIGELIAKLKSAEQKNEMLIAKANALMNEKDHQATSQYESALKIEELLKKLYKAEQDRADAQKLNNEHISQLESLAANSKVESQQLCVSLETVSAEKSALQKKLTAKGKEVADLQVQLTDLLDCVKSLQGEVEQERKEKAELEGSFSHTKTTMEQEVKNMTEQLELLEIQLPKLGQTVKSLEEQKGELISERDSLRKAIERLEEQATKQSFSLRNICEANEKLKSQSAKLQQTNQKLETKWRELEASNSSLEAEITSLRASEKQLQSQIDDAVMSVDEKEKKLRDQNKLLDENLQNAIRQNQALEQKLDALQADYQELKQSEETTQQSLSVLQAEFQNTKEYALQMEKSLSSLRQDEESLKLQVSEKDEALKSLENQCKQLQEQAERYQQKAGALEVQKANAEQTCLHQTKLIDTLTSEKTALQKDQLEKAASQERDAKDLASRLAISEEQLHLNQAEVLRLQVEITDLQAKLQLAETEKQKLQGKLDVRGTALNEQKTVVQQLKEQSEMLNRNHVQELLQYKEQEEMLKTERDQEASQKAELEKSLLCLKDELSKAKQCLEAVNLENMEIKDLLHRTNTDMAELGIQICALTSEKAEAEDKLSQALEELKTTKETVAKEREELQLDVSRLSKEKQGLQEKLEESNVCAAAVPAMQTQLMMAERQAQRLQETSKEELSAVKFQLSTEIINYQTKLKAISEECEKLKQEVEQQSQKAHTAEEALRKMQVSPCIYARFFVIERDKDALWQKSDALEFQQKLTAEQRWLGDAEVTCCLDCQKEFGWMNRRHHCRMCGRIFCYYCCNNYAMSKQTGKKERCCRACFKKSSVNSADSGSIMNQEEPTSSGLLASPLSLVQRVMDDAVFDIITDEEVVQIQEGDPIHNAEEESLTDLNSTHNSSTLDESDDLPMAQDAEICLLKSGELMLKLPLTVEEILKFGEANRELFIKSNTYSIITITAEESGLTISWVFSSDPKSISFSVVYRESEETPLDQCKVLIPMTRCHSHKETIQGKVKVRNTGIYILIFDNTFSRFISKRVFFHLSIQRPVVYDGSDLP
uniref:FYVE and coiled-coil domain-containing protein 1 n=1 Tax=Varanus komodoensis TaxID=61221 RepID=A0A8D2LX29_VARKO